MSRSSATQRRARPLAAALTAALLLAAFTALAWLDNSANRGITFSPAPQPIPLANGPALGVNLFNIHLEPDPAAVRRSFQLARNLGARYARMQVPWDDLEIHGRGDFEDRRNLAAVGAVSAWEKYDRIVAEANQADIALIMRLERPPDWARERFRATPEFQAGLLLDGNSTGPPDDLADYGRFVGAVVERYDGDGVADAPQGQRVRHFQLWNEPNLKGEWNWQTPSPEDFVALLRVGAEAARAASPAALILFPGLAPTDGLDPRAPMTELAYLDRVYQAGGAGFFDIMAAQSYGLGQPPSEHRYVFLRGRGNWSWRQPVDTRNDVSRVVLLREVMERNGDAQTPVWVTEFGWNSAPESIPPERRLTWGQPVSEATKGDYLVAQIERARAEWPWMGVLNVWMLRYGGYAEPDPADPTPYFALVSRDWQPTAAYERLRAYAAQPAVAGVGAFGWDHPAVEPIPGGWRLRFSGTRASLIGGLAGAITPSIDGQPVSLARDGLDGLQLLSTPQLPDGAHTLEVLGGPAPERFIVERARPLGWLWDYGPLPLLAALAASGALAMRGLFSGLDRLRARWRAQASPRAQAAATMGLMLLALAVAYRASAQLPLTLLGLAAFAGLALYRPNLALLWVILTVPLYFMPKGLFDARFGIRPEGLYLPLHEIVLLIAAGATAARGVCKPLRSAAAWRRAWGSLHTPAAGGRTGALHTPRAPRPAGAHGPEGRPGVLHTPPGYRLSAIGYRLSAIALFLAAGLWGLLIAGERGPALREFRWLILEPLICYGLVIYHLRQDPHDPARFLARDSLINAFLISGSVVGLLGVLQFLGLNLVPLIGTKAGFSDDSIVVEGVRRVNSVYGHPNNLGLFLGRVWPIAAALAVGRWSADNAERAERGHRTPERAGRAERADTGHQSADNADSTDTGHRTPDSAESAESGRWSAESAEESGRGVAGRMQYAPGGPRPLDPQTPDLRPLDPDLRPSAPDLRPSAPDPLGADSSHAPERRLPHHAAVSPPAPARGSGGQGVRAKSLRQRHESLRRSGVLPPSKAPGPWPLALLALLALGGLLVSFSRGAYLGAVAAALVLGLTLAPRGFWRSRRVLLPLGALAGLGLLAAVAVLALGVERLNPFGSSSGVRLQTWASALAMLRDHPLGVGLDQFGRLYPQYIAPELAGTNEINTAHPHTLLLDIALRMGPLGLIAFGWLIWRFFQATGGRGGRGTRTDASRGAPAGGTGARGTGQAGHMWGALDTPHAPMSAGVASGLAAAMAAALVHGLVDSFYFWPDLAFAFWLMLALAWHSRSERR